MLRDPIKVYDARWESGEFDEGAIRGLFEATYAYGRMLGVDTLTLARDARLDAGWVMEVAADAAVRAGLRVYVQPRPISTPQSYFMALRVSQEHPATMGLTITASHNPREYIGVKFTVPVVRAVGLDCGPMGGLAKVREIYHRGDALAPERGGSICEIDLEDDYIAYSMKLAGVEEGGLGGMGVAVDAFNGSAGREMERGLRRAGAEVHGLRMEPDGSFPGGSPNPTSHGKMDAAIQLAADRRCAAAIGVDGDGDRIVFADDRGVLSAGFAFVPILAGCGIAPPPAAPAPVLYDPKVNPVALVEWAKLNARPLLVRNGHSQIKDYMLRVGAVAGAEESGHFYHRMALGDLTICAENSLLTVLLFLGAIRRDAQLMGRLRAMQDGIFTTGEFNYQFADDASRDAAMAATLGRLVAEGAGTAATYGDGMDLEGTCVSRGVDLSNGRARLAEGWYSGFVRIATNEKGIVRSYFSAGDGATGRRIEERCRAVLEGQFGGTAVE